MCQLPLRQVQEADDPTPFEEKERQGGQRSGRRDLGQVEGVKGPILDP